MAYLLRSLAVGVPLLLPGMAAAGMGYPQLTDIARMRLQSISFFLFGFLGAAWLIQRLWNYLGRDFTFLPRLNYAKAVVLTGLWGMLFLLVLTMVSGARELMTPGAWERQGVFYKLRPPQETSSSDRQQVEKDRYDHLNRLRQALWIYARSNDNKFPSTRDDPRIPQELWQVPDPSGMLYLYRGGVVTANQGTPLVFEPEIFGEERWVLLSNGEMKRLTSAELARNLGLAQADSKSP